MTASEALLFIVKLIAGTGVFLVGAHILTENIEQLATNRIKNLFSKTAGKKLLNVGIGTLTTALIQSSGVTTVLIVGFVNVGIISLSQATAMIMGANIGTTITAQIASLSTFPFTTYIQVLAGVGILIAMICKKEKTKQVGFIISGFGLIFIGLSVMTSAMNVNRDAIQSIFETVTNPFLLFFIGIILTALVQSSSATTSVIIAMSVAGLTVGSGGNEMLYIILGTNIGSCFTALISSVGSTSNAKRAGIIHLMFNTFGTVLFFTILMCFPDFMQNTFAKWFPAAATQIAMFHTFFNVVCTIVFLPFSDMFVKLSKIFIKEKEEKPEFTYLDERVLSAPSIAIAHLKKELMLLGDMAVDAFTTSYDAFKKRDKSKSSEIMDKIGRANVKNGKILDFLIKTSANADESLESEITAIHANLGDIMRIADIADNFVKYTTKTVDEDLKFTDGAIRNVDIMVDKVLLLWDMTKDYVLNGEESLIEKIESTEEEIDAMRKSLIDDHIERLNSGICTPNSSSVFINLVSNLERMGDHITYLTYS